MGALMEMVNGRGKEEQKINNLQLRATEAQYRHKYKHKYKYKYSTNIQEYKHKYKYTDEDEIFGKLVKLGTTAADGKEWSEFSGRWSTLCKI